MYVDKLDHKVVAGEIMKVINKYDLKHDRIIAYVSDNVSYMSKAFTLFSCKYRIFVTFVTLVTFEHNYEHDAFVIRTIL